MPDYHHLRHVKEQTRSKRTLWITLLLTLFFTVVEVIGGLLSHSLALLSDSAHMISDVFALSLSMTAIYLASRPPNSRFSYGYLRFEIIASFLNGLALCLIASGIFIEGFRRFFFPEEIRLGLMLTIAVIGLLVNVILTVMLSRSISEEKNLNVQSALWHFIGDLLSSVGVILSAVVIYFTGLLWFDPLMSLVIGLIIFIGGARIVREACLILMESVPEQYDLEQIRSVICSVEGVQDVHELHLWTISTDHHSFSAHVFISESIQPFCVILAITETLKKQFDISHVTVQVEHARIHPHGEYGEKFLKLQDREA